MTNGVSPSDVTRFLLTLWRQGDVREVRIPKHDSYSTASGYFDTPEALADAALSWDKRANIYVTLNPVKSDLLARANNRIERRARHATSDQDVIWRRFLPIDIDPVRPSGVSATDIERQAAYDLLCEIVTSLHSWPEPITCLSGNGYYALYPIDLPNALESQELVQGVLRFLDQRFSNERARVDPTLANASRIIGLIGTLKMKGDSTKDRPHRRSKLLEVPQKIEAVHPTQLRRLAGDAQESKRTCSKGGNSEPVNLLLERHDVRFKEQPPDQSGNVWYHVERCPFHDDGRDFECGVGQAPDGRYLGKCFHPEGDGKGWREFSEALGLRSTQKPDMRRQDWQGEGVAAGGAAGAHADRSCVPTVFNRTDAGNGELFAALYRGLVLYDHGLERWLRWTGQRYTEDELGAVEGLAVEAARHRHHQAVHLADSTERKLETDFAMRSEDEKRIRAMLRQARRQPGVAERAEAFNRDPWLVGMENGVFDLRTQELRPGRQEDRITFSTGLRYDPDAACPRWERFLNEIFEGDLDLIDYIWRATGYSLSGNTGEQCFFICHGRGANGKSVMLNTLKTAAGDYGHTLAFSALEYENRGTSDPHVAELKGRRFVVSSEINEASRLNEAKLKALTGQDDMPARKLYKSPFSFVPEATLWLAVNHAPEIRDSSDASWRRIRVISFPRSFQGEEVDKELEEHLRHELVGILGWMLRGCREWQERGLRPPATVECATEQYRRESDPLAEFLDECCLPDSEATAQASLLYAGYREWAQARRLSEREILSSKAFGSQLTGRFPKGRNRSHTFYSGLRLIS